MHMRATYLEHQRRVVYLDRRRPVPGSVLVSQPFDHLHSERPRVRHVMRYDWGDEDRRVFRGAAELSEPSIGAGTNTIVPSPANFRPRTAVRLSAAGPFDTQ